LDENTSGLAELVVVVEIELVVVIAVVEQVGLVLILVEHIY